MKWRRPNSIRVRLTRRLVLWQLAMLAAFSLAASIPLAMLEAGGAGLDHKVIYDIADSVRSANGQLTVEPTKALNDVMRNYPEFWFYVLSEEGGALHRGNIPGAIATRLDYLNVVAFGDFQGGPTGGGAAFIVRKAPSPVGQIRIATGGGPRFEPLSWSMFLANRYFVLYSAIFSAVMIAVIAISLRQALRGLDAVAEEASQIDVGERGKRLTYEQVPVEIQPLVQAFNDALARLDQGIERSQRFLSDAAHELRTPIAILQLRAEMLEESPRKQELLMDIARLSNLANQLLDIQRTGTDRASLDILDLSKLVADATADIAPLSIDAGRELEFDASGAPVLVRGDAIGLVRAVHNLIQNALTYGGDRILVSVGDDGAVSVDDNGRGIPDEQRRLVFEPFYRLETGGHGAGLGLTLVAKVAHSHGGSVSVSDSDLGGARITIKLPLAN